MRPLAQFFSLVLVLATCWEAASAQEPRHEFVEGLRQRGYFDTAREYLEGLRANAGADDELRRVAIFELGHVCLHEAKTVADTEGRLKLFEEATRHFRELLVGIEHPSDLAPVFLALGKTQIERAQTLADLAKRTADADKAKRTVGQAVDEFRTARSSLNDAVENYGKLIMLLVPFLPKERVRERALRKERRENFLESQIALANCLYQHASILEPDAKERRELLTAAADKYVKVYRDYRTSDRGLSAGLQAGRCYHALGDSPRVLAICDELLRDLRASVLRFKQDARNHEQVKP